MAHSRLLRTTLMILVTVFAAAFLFTLFTSFAAGGDPTIPNVMITAVPPVHQVGADVYFNNSSGGQITAVVDISGTAPLTFTTAPAFDRPGEMFTYTTNSALAVLSYTVANNIGSQLGITYTVVNSNSQSAVAQIDYIRDITAPITIMTTTYGTITAPQNSLLRLGGTANDAGSGVDEIQITGAVTATLDITSPHATSTTWSYNWTIPAADGVGYTFGYRGTDNLGITETAHTQVITVNNVAPDPITPAITAQGVQLHVTWPASTASDFGHYALAIYEGNTVVVSTTQTSTGYTYSGTVGETYYAQLRVRDNVGNQSAIGTSNSVMAGAFVFMPVITNPYPAPQGALQFTSNRFVGVTTFISPVTVKLDGISFPGAPLPTQMRVWRGDQSEPTTWISYATTTNLTLSNGIGAQTIYARFRWTNGLSSQLVQGTVFYIPNGDFVDDINILQSSGWLLTSNVLPYSVNSGKLTLGSPAYGCTNVPIGDARASFNLNIPANSNYKLRVDATIYTYDQLPNPNQATFDAFEVHIDNSVTRFGNQQTPINCQTQRTITVAGPFNLQGYSGSTFVSLRNYSRFDNYYNTYTVIETVWVSE